MGPIPSCFWNQRLQEYITRDELYRKPKLSHGDWLPWIGADVCFLIFNICVKREEDGGVCKSDLSIFRVQKRGDYHCLAR